MSDTTIDRSTDETTEQGRAKAAHIVKTDAGESATAKVLAARIEGTSIEALCGVVFVPQQDPTKLPLCQACKDIYEMYRAYGEGLNDRPDNA